MSIEEQNRPDPDTLLQLLKKEEEKEKRGKLKIFFGMCAGVGKTYDMLRDAHAEISKGIDVIIGYIETHKRIETEALLTDLPVIPRKTIEYKGTILEEMDLDAIISRKPQLVLVDELAHTNVPGSRHTKRYQDVLELLDNGIDVFTTLNVQHLESRAETVAQITGSIIHETVPDSIFEAANEVEVIDISPNELLKRLSDGKVYTPERSQRAVQNFFRAGNLSALREMSLRLTAERVDQQLREYKQTKRISETWKSGTRLVVGINASLQSLSVIRWARRVSYTMDASWVAVYVETSKKATLADTEQLSKNFKLARELGAEIVTTSDEDIAGALLRVAREQNATQILIGKPKPKAFFHTSRLVKNLLRKSRDIDVYVVGHEEEKENQQQLFFQHIPNIQSGLPQYLLATMIILGVSIACIPLARLIEYKTISYIILFAVSLLPLRMGRGPVLLGATCGALAWDFLFITPIYTFSIGRIEDVLMLLVFFIVATVSGTLSARVRERERAVRQREMRSSALFALTKDLSSAHSQDEVIQATSANIKKFFNADVVVFLGDADGDMSHQAHTASSWKPDEKEFSVAAWTYWNEKKAGKFTDTLPFAQATYYSMSGPRYPVGVIGVRVRQNEKLGIDQEILLENFIAQIASAVERELLNEVTKKSIVVAESEKLYKTLFNSISHELRTPIAAILGSSEGLLFADRNQEKKMHDDLLGEIHTAAERLNRLVENLLDMTRLESGQLAPKMDWCDVRDIINTSLKKLEKELSRHIVQVHIDENNPLVLLDFVLLEQVFTNILHNASLYTPAGSTIDIQAHVQEDELFILISDNGRGFPPEVLKTLFEKFYRVPGTQTGGTGLGLSIAKGFVEAHKGTIQASNNPHGGACFTIRIPIEAQQSLTLQ